MVLLVSVICYSLICLYLIVVCCLDSEFVLCGFVVLLLCLLVSWFG